MESELTIQADFSVVMEWATSGGGRELQYRHGVDELRRCSMCGRVFLVGSVEQDDHTPVKDCSGSAVRLPAGLSPV